MAHPSSTPDTTRWWWVRHAPVPDGGRIYGQTDLDCDCTAAAVFAALAASLPDGAVWLTSNLGRTHQTAAAIIAASERAERRAIKPEPVPAFAEQHLGDWQGMDRETFRASRPHVSHDHWFGPATERPPNGESFAELYARVGVAMVELTETHRGRDVVAITHGGTVRAALGHALDLGPEGCLAFTIDNCSLTRIDQLGGDPRRRWRVVTVNHHPATGPSSGLGAPA